MPAPRPIKERLLEKIVKNVDCWEFTGCLHYKGYGEIGHNGRSRRAHRVSYEIFKGQIPKGLCVMHSCDNRKCVNPEHLSLGTIAQNQADMKRKGRSRNSGGRGEESCHHKLTEEEVLEIRRRFSSGETDKTVLAKDFNITRTSVYYIVTRKQWSHI